jgi:hypothetical protein
MLAEANRLKSLTGECNRSSFGEVVERTPSLDQQSYAVPEEVVTSENGSRFLILAMEFVWRFREVLAHEAKYP